MAELVMLVILGFAIPQTLGGVLLWRLRTRSSGFLGFFIPASSAVAYFLLMSAYAWLRVQPPPADPNGFRCGEIYVAVAFFTFGGALVHYVVSAIVVTVFALARGPSTPANDAAA